MTPAPRVVRCPAKLNLALRVLHRRDDGYHELDTVFQAIDLWDTLAVEPAEELSLRCDDPSLEGPENLVLRAAAGLQARAGSRDLPGAALSLTKRIPTGAGLGGGSSDAAGALLLLSRFWDLELSPRDLATLAAGLGADVPFFLTGGTARGRGRGDRIEPLPFLGDTDFVLGFPPFGISTAQVFGMLAGRLTLPRTGVSLRPLLGHKWPEEKDLGFVGNDLQPVVFERWPELAGFRDALLEVGAARAVLSGSGSTVYGVFEGLDKVENALSRLRPRFADWELRHARAVRDGARLHSPGG